ncbi:MAG: transcriptional repressor [Actinobacteria bacterium]|nr:transcriptional repressor [Actinomycetota bacterium]
MGPGKDNIELENVLRTLRERGHRVTPQRRAILREALSTRGHISPGGVAHAVAQRLPGVNASTVYRTLGLLEQLGFVSHSHGEEGYAYHLAGRADHVHLVCNACGRDLSLDIAETRSLAGAIERQNGFTPDFTHFAISGVCGKCRETF